MSTRLSAARVLEPGGCWGGPATLTLTGGHIAGIDGGLASDAEHLQGGVLTAGMLDLHNNGAFGVDFAEAGAAEWRAVLGRLAARGVTAVQPTIITAPIPALVAACEGMASAVAAYAGEPVARVLGIHLEGPFLAPARRGAHRVDWIVEPTTERLDAVLDSSAVRHLVRMVTLAPEQPGGLDAVQRLVAAGIVVAIGHSDATAAEATAAVEAGATVVTHIFNAMRPFGHRDPGLPGVALTDPRLRSCVIVDGQHVDPVAARLVFAAAGARTIAVTDSIAVAGLLSGASCRFGGAAATLGPDGLGRRDDGTIAGAGIVLDEGVRRMIQAGIAPASVLHAATQAPADAVGRPDLGRLAIGALADLVWWDAAWIPPPGLGWRGGGGGMKWSVGLMTGTVLDGNIDIALVRTDGETIAELGPWTLAEYAGDTQALLSEALQTALRWQFGGPEPAVFALAEAALTRAQSQAVLDFLAEQRIDTDEVGVIGFHGQTVLHRAPRPGHLGDTRQLGDGTLMAKLTGIDVVYDFRTADVRAGGQGAPLSASYHAALLRRLGVRATWPC